MVKGKTRATMIVGNRYRDGYSPSDKFSNTPKLRGKKKKKKKNASSKTLNSSKSSKRNTWVLSYLPKKEN